MLNIFEELKNVKEDEVVEGEPVTIGGLLILAGFLIVNIHE